MRIKYDDLSVCTDCLIYLANGEATSEHFNAMSDHWGDDLMHMVPAGGDEEEGWFSWSSCDGCESNLGGQRFRAAILEPSDD